LGPTIIMFEPHVSFWAVESPALVCGLPHLLIKRNLDRKDDCARFFLPVKSPTVHFLWPVVAWFDHLLN
jgi:hypothetical protein